MIRGRLMTWVVVIILAVLAGTVGAFLNVLYNNDWSCKAVRKPTVEERETRKVPGSSSS